MDPQDSMNRPSTSYQQQLQDEYARQPTMGDLSMLPMNAPSAPIPTPPPSAHGSISPISRLAYANGQSQEYPPGRLSNQIQRNSMPNISEQARLTQSSGPYPQHPSQPRPLPQANGHYRMPAQAQMPQQQQHQQHQQHLQQQQPQYYVNGPPRALQSLQQQQLQHMQQMQQAVIQRSASDPALIARQSHLTQSPFNMRPAAPSDLNAQNRLSVAGPGPQMAPASQSQPPPQPSTLTDPAISTFNLLQPAKNLLEKTWTTTVAVVQHELAAVATAHAQVMAENAHVDQQCRRLYADLQRSEAERARLSGELEGLRMAKGAGDATSREMQARIGEYRAQAHREAQARMQVEQQLAQATAKFKQFIHTCKCGVAPAVLTTPLPVHPAHLATHEIDVIDLTRLDDPQTAPTPRPDEPSVFYGPQTPAVDDSPREMRRNRDEADQQDEGGLRKRRRLSAEEGNEGSVADASSATQDGLPDVQVKTDVGDEQGNAGSSQSMQFPTPDVKSEDLPSEFIKSETQEATEPHGHPLATPSPSGSGNGNPKAQSKIGLQHLELVYEIKESSYTCRMCQQRKRDADAPENVATFPKTAQWDVLVGHCEENHPAAFDVLVHMSSGEIAEMRQRINSKR